MYSIRILTVVLGCLLLLRDCMPQSNDDFYTFCGKGRLAGDSSACQGYCSQGSPICSAETGVCSCSSPARMAASSKYYDCRPARSRTRCHNACKAYTMLNPKFRRGEVKVCQSKSDDRKMCFCLPKS